LVRSNFFFSHYILTYLKYTLNSLYKQKTNRKIIVLVVILFSYFLVSHFLNRTKKSFLCLVKIFI
jgi:hypothetical protein